MVTTSRATGDYRKPFSSSIASRETSKKPALFDSALTRELKKREHTAQRVKEIWKEQHKHMNHIHYSALWKALSDKKTTIAEDDRPLLEATQKQFEKCDPRAIAQMANAWSKLEVKDPSCWEAVAIATQNQLDKDKKLCRFTSQGLAMLANGLSKVEGVRVSEALKAIAAEVARRALSVFIPQDLAMIANSLSKAEGERVSEALKAIAAEVARRDLYVFLSQHLAMIANGLSKAEGVRVSEALKAIAVEVARRDLSAFIPQELAMLANGLSKAEGVRVSEALKAIAVEVARRGLSAFIPQELAMLANGLSKAGGERVSEALKAIAAEVVRRDLSVFLPQELAMLANGLSKTEGERVSEALKAIAAEVARRGLSVFIPQGLAMLANGLSKIEGEQILCTLGCIADEIAKPDRDVSQFSLQELVNILFAFTHQGMLNHPAFSKLLQAVCLVFENQKKMAEEAAIRQLLQTKLFFQYQAPKFLKELSDKVVDSLDTFEKEFAKERPASSALHLDIAAEIQKLYPDVHVLNECYLAASFVDIFIPEMNLYIAVNGPCHYIEDTHTLKSDRQFQEKLVKTVIQRQGACFMVIPYWDWDRLKTDDEKQNYLQCTLEYLFSRGPEAEQEMQKTSIN